MPYSRQWIGCFAGGLLVAAVALLLCLHFRHLAPAARRGRDRDFQPQVYLWQRAWTDSVRRALPSEAPAFRRIVVLARQIDFDKTPPHVTRVAVDWPALKATGTPIAAALRIGVYTGPFEGPSADLVTQTTREILHDATAVGITLAEIQIDFDAPTSKLAGYRTWLAQARKAAEPIPVTLTALPTWLDSPAFAPLAQEAGYFVLQVHWLDRPHRAEDPLVLCDLATARRAIAKAAQLKIPFRVALPTYSYVAGFNPDGSFAGMIAEGAPPNWGEGKTLRLVEAQPTELAAFVNELAAARPISLRGIIWYRLPIDADRLNWSFTTLQCVIAGQVPRPGKLAVQCLKTADNLYDIQLHNLGQRDIDSGCRVTLDWKDSGFVAADALAGFQLADHSASTLEILPGGAGPGWLARLKPSECRTIAWLRLNKETPIHASIDTHFSPGPGAADARPGFANP